MSAQMLDAWSCPTCISREVKSHEHGGAGSCDTVSFAGSDGETSLSDVMAKLDTVLQQLNALKRNQEEQSERIQSIKASQAMLSSKYNDIIRSLEGEKEELKDVKKKTNYFEAKVAAQSVRISYLENEVVRLEQYSRKYNIEIHGIKVTDGEDLQSVLKPLATKLKLPV